MIRTQISLDKKEYALAKSQAKALGISVAELVPHMALTGVRLVM